MNSQEQRSSALWRQEVDDKKTLVEIASLPLDLVLHIISSLPSVALFNLRCLCKATHSFALRTLARRPFFILQKNFPSPLCYLLPLDLPCSPLPCSFNLAKPSFRVLFTSGNLLCLHRQYPSLLDICVCDIFGKWKIVLPPIVLPSFAPQISRRVFAEDTNAEFLRVVGFHAVPNTTETQEEDEVHSPVYRIFVASPSYLRVFDSHVKEWSAPLYFPSHLSARSMKAPMGFATSDGNLILTFSFKVCALFNYDDQSFHAMELGFHPSFEVAGYLASAEVDSSFNLKIQLAHVREQVHSSPAGGLVLQESCKSDVDSPNYGYFRICVDGDSHRRKYSRCLLHSFCHAYQGKVYALVMERDEMCCFIDNSPAFTSEEDLLQWAGQAGMWKKCEGNEWHDLASIDVEKCLHPDEGTTFNCADFFPARSSPKLTLYSASIDMTNWKLTVSKEADATACLEVFDIKGGRLSFVSG